MKSSADNRWYRFVYSLLCKPVCLLMNIHVDNEEIRDLDEPFVAISNHPSPMFLLGFVGATPLVRDTAARIGKTKAINENAAWQAIGAIKNNRLYFLPQDLFLLSPGLRYSEAVKTMAELIYPEKF